MSQTNNSSCSICGLSGKECKRFHKSVKDAFNTIDSETGKTYSQLLKEKISNKQRGESVE